MRKSESLAQYIELLKSMISADNNDAVKIEGDKLLYSLKRKYSRDISSNNQNTLGELGRALAVLHLITENKIPPNLIHLEEGSEVGARSKRVDIKIEIADVYNERNCIALVECKTSINKISDSKFTNYFKRQLYNIAHSYAKDKNQPYPLVLVAYEITFDEDNKPRVFYRYFFYPEIEKAIETGQVSIEEVLSRNSPFAYSTPPKISNNVVYFHKKPLTKEDLIDIKNSNQLKHLLKEKLHQGLRNYGIVENDAFKVIVNLLLAKTYDEIQLLKDGKEEPDFQVKPEDYRDKSAFYRRIKNLYEQALINLLREDAKEAKRKEILYHEEREKILLDLVPYLQRIKLRSLRFLGEDSIGDVFLDFMHSIFRQSRALFFTHPNICRFVCKALNIEKVADALKNGEYKYILDPSCGSGTFLIEAMRLIFKDYPLEQIQEKAIAILYGIDNEEQATALCKVNMVIHGDGSANIYTRNALSPLGSLPLPFTKENYIMRLSREDCTTESIKETSGVDFIITNPPFSLEIRRDEYDHFRMKKFLVFKENVSNASECLFVERWYQLLNPKGRLGAVLPFSLLDSTEYLNARLLFLCYFKVIAIVGLPEHAFAPFAQQRTALVFAERRPLEESNQLFSKINEISDFIKQIEDEKIILYDAKNIGYLRVKRRKTVNTIDIKDNDLTDTLASIIAKAFDGDYQKDSNITVKTLGEIYKERGLILTPTVPDKQIQINSSRKFNLKGEWQIVEVEKVKEEEIDMNNVLVCETGDITPGGFGILTPKSLNHTTESNKERINRKIDMGRFGVLKPGDVIIAPVRVYQKKIAVITKSASKFLFSEDFIVLRRKKPDLKKSFTLFLSLIDDANIKQLESLSSTGKSGYPKIKNKEAILQMDFYEVRTRPEEIAKLIKLYDDIYKNIFLRYSGQKNR